MASKRSTMPWPTPRSLTQTRRFKDIFQDFAVANYAKDLISNPAPAALQKYNYIDDEAPGLDFGKVFVSRTSVVTPGTSLLDTAGVNAWAAQYFEFDLDPSVSTVNLQVNPLARHTALALLSCTGHR